MVPDDFNFCFILKKCSTFFTNDDGTSSRIGIDHTVCVVYGLVWAFFVEDSENGSTSVLNTTTCIGAYYSPSLFCYPIKPQSSSKWRVARNGIRIHLFFVYFYQRGPMTLSRMSWSVDIRRNKMRIAIVSARTVLEANMVDSRQN